MMPLPMNVGPVYTLTIPSTKKELKYRPFFVKEEKALLIAQQSEDPLVMLDTIKEVIQSCAKTPIDVDRLASFDIEYIFLKLRSVSVGEIANLMFACDEDHGADNDKAISHVAINLNDAKVEFQEQHKTTIMLFDSVGVKMKYPRFDTMKKLEVADIDDIDTAFDIAIDCIDCIFDGDQVFDAGDQKREELIAFLEQLTAEQFDKVRQFFVTMPALRLYLNYKCPVCDKEHSKYVEGLSSFFQWR